MPRYIDAETFWKKLTSKCEEDWVDLMVVCELLEEMETADIVEVVWCKDCKHYIKHDKRCGILNHGMKEVDFCSYGERREDGESNS